MDDQVQAALEQSTSVQVQTLEPSMNNIIIGSRPTEAQSIAATTRLTDFQALQDGFNSVAGKSVIGAYAFLKDAIAPVDTNYVPLTDPLLKQEGEEFMNRYAEEFVDSPNSEITRERLIRMKAYEENAKLVSAGGIPALLGSFAGVATDPSLYIPVAGLAGAGSGVAKAINMSKAILGTSAYYEYSTAYIDPEKDGADALYNTLINTAVGGLFMAAGYAATAEGRANITNIFKGTFDEVKASKDVMAAGAKLDAAVPNSIPHITESLLSSAATPGSYKIATTNWAVGASNWLAKIWSPARRAATAELDQANFIGELMYENTWHLKGSLEGKVTRPDSIGVVGEQLASKRNPVILGMDEHYVKYQKDGGKLKPDEFRDYIEKSAIQDIPVNEMPVEFQAAASMREKYYSDQYADLIKEESLPELALLTNGKIVKSSSITDLSDQIGSFIETHNIKYGKTHGDIKSGEELVKGISKLRAGGKIVRLDEQLADIKAQKISINKVIREKAELTGEGTAFVTKKQKLTDKIAKMRENLEAQRSSLSRLKDIQKIEKQIKSAQKNIGISVTSKNIDSLDKLIAKKGASVLPGGRKIYAPLIPDVDNIMGDYNGALKAFSTGFMNKNPELTEEIATKAAAEYISHLVHGKGVSMFNTLSFTPSFLKKRVLDIDTNAISDYISTDFHTNLGLYSNSVSKHLAVKKVLGVNNPDKMLTDLDESYATAIETAMIGGDTAKVNRLQKERVTILQDFKNHFTHFLGKDRSAADRYSITNSAMEVLKSVQAMSKMGLVALYAPLDMMRSQISVKVATQYGDDLSAFAHSLKGVSASKEDLALVNVGMESTNARRSLSISDIDEEQLGNKKVVKGIHKAQNLFYYATLTSPSTDYARKLDFAAFMKFVISGSRYMAKKADQEDLHTLSDLISRGGNKSVDLLEKEFRRMGIDPKDVHAISDAYEANKVVNDDGVFYNVANWGDIGEKVQRAGIREMRGSIIMPGIENKPECLKTPIGKVVGQFKGYLFGAFDKGLTKDMQELYGVDSLASAMAAGRIISLTVGGSLVYITREAIKGNLDKIDLSPQRLAAEGFDKGGAFPALDFMGSIMDRVGVGPASLLGARKTSRFLDQSITDQVLGPSAGSANVIYNNLGSLARGDITPAQYRQLVQQLPGANTMYTIGLVNKIGAKQ